MSSLSSFPIALIGSHHLTNAYTAWQQQTSRFETPGTIEYAADYVDFCIDADPRYFHRENGADARHVALKCGHTLHPASQDHEYCPVCIVDTYLDVLWKVASAWDRVGGPWQGPANAKFLQRRQVLRTMWIRFRLELAQLALSLEEEAGVEAEWGAGHPDAGGLDKVFHTATNAVARAVGLAKYPVMRASGVPCNRDTAGSYSQPTSKRQKKTVRFTCSATVVDEPAPTEVNANSPDHQHASPPSPPPPPPSSALSPRPPENWTRASPHYSPGRYAPSQPEGWADTSFASDTLYTLKQLRVYISNSNSDSNSNSTSNAAPVPDEPPPQPDAASSAGLACEHAFWPEIRETLSADLVSGRLEAWMLARAHSLVVGVRHGGFRWVTLHSGGGEVASEEGVVGGEEERVWVSEARGVESEIENCRLVSRRCG